MQAKAGQADAGFETGEQNLVGGDGGQPGQGNLQDVMVEERDAEQCCGEEDEVDGDACDGNFSIDGYFAVLWVSLGWGFSIAPFAWGLLRRILNRFVSKQA
jgi:hypothetical protein